MVQIVLHFSPYLYFPICFFTNIFSKLPLHFETSFAIKRNEALKKYWKIWIWFCVGERNKSNSQDAVTGFNSWHWMKGEKRYEPHSAFIKRIYNWWQILYIINWRHCTGRILSLDVLLLKKGKLCLLEVLLFLVNKFQFKCQYQKCFVNEKPLLFSQFCVAIVTFCNPRQYIWYQRESGFYLLVQEMECKDVAVVVITCTDWFHASSVPDLYPPFFLN